MLKRLVTAAVLIPIVFWSVLALPSAGFALAFAAFALAGAWEWSRLVPLHGAGARISYLLLVLLGLAAAWRLRDHPGALRPVLAVGVLGWLAALIWLSRAGPSHAPRRVGQWLKAAAGIGALGMAWLALVSLHGGTPRGPALVLFLLVLIWCADSGAYLAGRRWGRRKLAPAISPGKTWEGVLGGLAAAGVFSLLGGWLLDWRGGALLRFQAMCLVTVMFSVVGDLTESLFKRQVSIKDSGALLPGHGGVLDRIDSLLAAAPVFVLALYLMDL
ncbi:MAG TPA: phosphatidate cytidylyltransferase [Gammaproteobacteria bacterium]|nr:phosphatidate cytidylyltransferase [Gammaproteobacteria bacterium]